MHACVDCRSVVPAYAQWIVLNDAWGTEKEAVGCVIGQSTENSEMIVYYGFLSHY